GVAVPVVDRPPDQTPVASVLGRSVGGVEDVRQGGAEQLLDTAVALVGEDEVLGHTRQGGEVASGALVEMGQALAVDLLEAPDGPRELALGLAERPLDADAPP